MIRSRQVDSARPARRVAGFFGFTRSTEAPERPASALDDAERPVVAEACAKAGLIWVKPSGEGRFHAAWKVWHDDALHVISGIGEQLLPPLVGPVDVLVPSKETGARALTLSAWGTTVAPLTQEWDSAADALRAARLNTTEPAEQRTRWAGGTVITRLDPIAVLGLGAGPDDAPSGAAPPPRTPATTTGRRPWHLRGRARARLRARRGRSG